MAKLSEVCSKIGSGATPRGGKEVYCDKGISLIRSQNVLDYEFLYDGLAHINDEQASKLNNVAVEPEDVLLNITGDSVARVCIVPNDVLPARVNQHVAIIRKISGLIESKYLLYLLEFNKLRFLKMAEVGATRNALTKAMIEDFEFNLPDIKIQKKIVNILGVLDEKINLNIIINDNLEEIVELLFDQWFYQFEFLLENGDKFKSSGGNFKESSLGEIPTDFNVGTMKQIIKFSNGKKRPDENGEIPVYGGNGILDWVESSNYMNLIIIGRVGAYCGSLYLEPRSCWVSDNAIAAIPKQSKNYYAYQLLKKYNLNRMHIGSSQPLLTQGILNSIEVVLPQEKVIDSFNKLIEPVYKKIFQNRTETEQLKLLRDTLLPKLMSGEIDLDNLGISN